MKQLLHTICFTILSTAACWTQLSTFELFSIPNLEINQTYINLVPYYETNSSLYSEGVIKFQDKLLIKWRAKNNNHYMLVEGDKVFLYYPEIDGKYLFYDFGMMPGDTVPEGPHRYHIVTEKSTIVLNDGRERILLELSNGSNKTQWIQGIGDANAGMLIGSGPDSYNQLSCVRIKDELVYSHPDQDKVKCDSLSCGLIKHSFDLIQKGKSVEIVNQESFDQTFIWDFGDGNTSTELNPSHQYQEAGCYKVQLLLNNVCGDEVSKHRFASTCDNNNWRFNTKVKQGERHFQIGEESYILNEELYKINEDGSLTEINNHPLRGTAYAYKFFDKWNSNKSLVLHNSEIFVSVDNENWQKVSEAPFLPATTYLGQNGKAWIISDYFFNNEQQIYRTLDYGQNWLLINNTPDIRIFEFTYSEDNHLACIAKDKTYNKYIGKSLDNGDTWTWQALPTPLSNMQMFSKEDAYALDQNQLVKTNDGGTTWNPIENLPAIKQFDFHSLTHGWMLDTDGIIYYSDDGLNTFTITNCNEIKPREVHAINKHKANASIYVMDSETFHYDRDFYIFDAELLEPCKEPTPKRNITIWPNPTSSKIWYEIENHQILDAQLFNINGQLLNTNITCNPLDLSDYPKGIYLLKLWDNGGIHSTRRVVKL